MNRDHKMPYQASKSLHDQAFHLVETQGTDFKTQWNSFRNEVVRVLSGDHFPELSAPYENENALFVRKPNRGHATSRGS